MDMDVPNNMQLTPEASLQLEEGILAVLSNWFAFRVAVKHRVGGPHSCGKARNLIHDIFTFFNQPNRREPLCIDDLESMLAKTMAYYFHTYVEDDSLEKVAYMLMTMHEECLHGNYQSVKKARPLRPMPIHAMIQAEEDEYLRNGGASRMLVSSGSMSNSYPAHVDESETSPQEMPEWRKKVMSAIAKHREAISRKFHSQREKGMRC